MSQNNALYLDHSATTPPRIEVIEAISQAMREEWGNPSSLHGWGQRAAFLMETARQQVADLIGSDPTEILFTSGGTEANNLALWGIVRQYPDPQHLIISSVEHASVENVARELERLGWSVTRLSVDAEGLVSVDSLQAALRENTVLVSIVHGQNEIGSVQPIAELAEICQQAGIPFHTDCIQTAGRIPLAVKDLPVDLLSLSGHKLYGPQGIGALYVRSGVKLHPLMQGGGQENRIRSGTQAVPQIAGLGIAAELAQRELAWEIPRLKTLQQQLYLGLRSLADLTLTGASLEQRLPHHLSYWCEGYSGTFLVQQLHQAGIAISAGSACSSGKLVPSRVLLAMGYSPTQALGSIRLSLGKATTTAAIEFVIAQLQQILGSDQALARDYALSV